MIRKLQPPLFSLLTLHRKLQTLNPNRSRLVSVYRKPRIRHLFPYPQIPRRH